MSENEKLTSVSKAATLEEIAEFWDTHSLDDYWDETTDATFEVRAERRRWITLDPEEVYAQVQSEARKRGVLPETLVNIWLLERLQNAV